MTQSPFRLPLRFLLVLWAAVIGGTAAIFGFTTQVSAPIPQWIWNPPLGGTPVTECQVGRQFNLVSAVSGGTVIVCVDGEAVVSMDGNPIGNSTSAGEVLRCPTGQLAAGRHEVVIAATASPTTQASNAVGGAAICAYLELPMGAAAEARVATSASWWSEAQGANPAAQQPARAKAKVVGSYGGPPRGDVFGKVEPFVAGPRDLRFWTVFGLLLAALALTCLAGPVLRPGSRRSEGSYPVDMAVLVPSLLYALSAASITALAGTAIGTGWIVGLHVGAAAVFCLALVVWQAGAAAIDRDQVIHRAELRGFDDMVAALRALEIEVDSSSAEFQASVRKPLHELCEQVRYSSTTSVTPELDQQIVESLQGLAEVASSGDSPAFLERLRGAGVLVRRREARAQGHRTR